LEEDKSKDLIIEWEEGRWKASPGTEQYVPDRFKFPKEEVVPELPRTRTWN
jgi:hypothetical protein